MVRGLFQATARKRCLLLEAPGDKRRNDRYTCSVTVRRLSVSLGTGGYCTEGTGGYGRVREGTDGRVREGSGKGLPIGFERVREGTRGWLLEGTGGLEGTGDGVGGQG